MCRQIESVLVRAQEAGQARPDIALADIVNLIWSNGRMIDATSTTAPNEWRRQLYLMLDAYRAERAHPIPEPPMTHEQLYDAMVHLGEANEHTEQPKEVHRDRFGVARRSACHRMGQGRQDAGQALRVGRTIGRVGGT